jgi:hypothetical protein
MNRSSRFRPPIHLPRCHLVRIVRTQQINGRMVRMDLQPLIVITFWSDHRHAISHRLHDLIRVRGDDSEGQQLSPARLITDCAADDRLYDLAESTRLAASADSRFLCATCAIPSAGSAI